MRRLACVILVLLLTISVFSGCGAEDEPVVDTANQGFGSAESVEISENVPSTDVEEKEYTDLTVEYAEIGNNKVEVVGFSGEGNRAIIDFDYEGKEIVRIADGAFENCTSLETVYMWADVKEIGASAFRNCTSLTEFTVPNETETIGEHAFEGCSALETLIVWGDPDIGDYAFAGCSSLPEVSISADTEYVGAHAFDGCTSLAYVFVWGEDTVFGKNAFINCPNLTDKPIEDDLSEVAVEEEETNNVSSDTPEDTNPEEANTITVSMSEEEFKGMPYSEAEELLREMGFEVFEYEDIESNTASLENTVAAVEIKTWMFGEGDFSEGDTYEPDATVVLWYYIYEEPEAEPINLTAENCEDVATLLALKDPSDPFVASFASAYMGEVIEFDGCVWAMDTHGDFDTRYDILLGTGDFDPNVALGPNFRLTDVNAFDMELDTLWLTDILFVGCNVHVIAEVDEYNPNTGLFELDVISVKVR